MSRIRHLVNRIIRFKYLLVTFKDYSKRLNRTVDVEAVLCQVANGKRPLLTAQECKELADKLGIPSDFRK